MREFRCPWLFVLAFQAICLISAHGQEGLEDVLRTPTGEASTATVRAGSVNPYRVTVLSHPTPIVAGYPSYFQIQVTQPLEFEDPLLGSEMPVNCQVSVEIRSSDNRHLLAGPALVPSQTNQAGVFAIEHHFDSAGSYVLGLSLFGVNGRSDWHPLMIQVSEDPYAWVDLGFWFLFAVTAVVAVFVSWKKVSGAPKSHLRAVTLSLIFSLLMGLLFLQFLAPLTRRHLWEGSGGEEPWSLVFANAGREPVSNTPVEEVNLSTKGQPYFAVATFPAMQSGQPVALTISLKGEKGPLLGGKLKGELQPLDSDTKTAGLAPSMAHHHGSAHKMNSSAPAKNLPMDFRESQSGVYHSTLLPDRGGEYRLLLDFQADPIQMTFESSKIITIGTQNHMAQMGSNFNPGFSSGRFLAFSAALIFLGATTLMVLFFKSRWKKHPWTLDLFQWRPLYSFVRWKYFQPALWIPNLFVFALVIYLGIWDTQEGGQNLATKLTWTIWWAAIIFAFVFVGKIWCTMCPFGALTIWTSRTFSPKRRLPRVLRNIWIANLAFFFVTWADDFWGIVSTPRYTALLVILVALSAMAIGFLFERATFCRHLCPIGGLIGIYSMFSGLELRARNHEICRRCKGKECYTGTPELPGCPMILFPATIDQNNYCMLCGDCVKVCPYENLTLRIRPFAQDIWKSCRRHLDEAFLAIALVGLTVVVTGHMIEPWHNWMDAVGAWVPWETLGVHDHEMVEKWTFSLIYVTAILIVSPLLLLGASALAIWLAHGRASLDSTFRTYAYMFIPVGIGLHLAHNLLHLLKEGGGIIPVVQRTVAKYTPVNLGNAEWYTPVIVSDLGVYWLQMGTLVVFYLASVYLGYRIALGSAPDRQTALRTVLPMVALSLAFTLFNMFLLSQPMAARHHH